MSLLSSSVPPPCPTKPRHLCPCWVGPANVRLGSPPRRARPFWGLTTEMPNIWGSLRPDGATHHGELTVLERNQETALLRQPSLLWGIVVSPVALLTAPPCPSATPSPVPCAGPGQATSSLSGWAWLSLSHPGGPVDWVTPLCSLLPWSWHRVGESEPFPEEPLEMGH